MNFDVSADFADDAEGVHGINTGRNSINPLRIFQNCDISVQIQDSASAKVCTFSRISYIVAPL